MAAIFDITCEIDLTRLVLRLIQLFFKKNHQGVFTSETKRIPFTPSTDLKFWRFQDQSSDSKTETWLAFRKKTGSNDIDTAAIEPSSHNYRTSRWSDYKRPCSQRTIMPALFSFWLLSLRPLPITLKRSQTGRSIPLSTSSRGRTRKTYPLDSILTLLHDASTRTWHWRVPSAGSLVGSRTVDVEYEWFR